MIRSLLKRLIRRAVQSDAIWRVLNRTAIPIAEVAKWERYGVMSARQVSDPVVRNALLSISPLLTTRHGPFRGMRYPGVEAVGSSVAPKLIGSYERELHATIERICATAYTDVVDVGCAEGYYAVGLALRLPTARVYAFDTNERAVRLCEEMANLNGVGDRVSIGAFCDDRTLRAMRFAGRALILSDCEGYESSLFTDEVVRSLSGHDVLVEVHDFLNIEISTTLRKRFAPTHEIAVIQSIDDITKAHTYEYDELQGRGLVERRALLAEGRPGTMEWFFMTPRPQ